MENRKKRCLRSLDLLGIPIYMSCVALTYKGCIVLTAITLGFPSAERARFGHVKSTSSVGLLSSIQNLGESDSFCSLEIVYVLL